MKNILMSVIALYLFGCSTSEQPNIPAPETHKTKVEYGIPGNVHFAFGGYGTSTTSLPENVQINIQGTHKEQKYLYLERFDSSRGQLSNSSEVLEYGCSEQIKNIPERIEADVVILCGEFEYHSPTLTIVANRIILNSVRLHITGDMSEKLNEDSMRGIQIDAQNLELNDDNYLLVEGESTSHGRSMAPLLTVRAQKINGSGQLKIESLQSYSNRE